MKTRIEMLKEMGVSDSDAEQYIHHLEEALPKYGIADSRLRLAHFFAQVLHESGCMRFDMENLNYSSEALRKVFGKYFTTKEEADAYARQPEKIANQGLRQPHGQPRRDQRGRLEVPGPRAHPADRPEQLQGLCRVGG